MGAAFRLNSEQDPLNPRNQQQKGKLCQLSKFVSTYKYITHNYRQTLHTILPS